MNYLKGKVALITGGAGGIAREIAGLLEDQGVTVALTDINLRGLRAASANLKNKPFIIPCDITRSAAVAGMVRKVRRKLGRIDMLINTAGIIVPGPFEEARIADIELQVRVNLVGAMIAIRETLPFIRESEGGAIVTISSMAGIVPETYSAVYTATKYALRGLGLTLNLELKRHKIHVATVFPDSVDTPMLRYEAAHGGSPLTFLSAPQQPVDVARAVLRAIVKRKAEVYVPASTGFFSRIVTVWPRLVLAVWPTLERMGSRNKAKILKNFELEREKR
ncbi:MAG: SDR family oxidoreductase [Spirochaetes bacterium]|nr:MAG: SDR family oxidoreductase [Spirochaetota bacterium]